MWKENSAGEWYWPLHPERQEDHLRVWKTGSISVGGPVEDHDEIGPWMGALVIDGDYFMHVEGATGEYVKDAILASAKHYLAILRAALG